MASPEYRTCLCPVRGRRTGGKEEGGREVGRKSGEGGVTFVFLFLVTLSDLLSLDRHWLPGLESSGWLARVRSCLLVAKEVTSTIFLKRRCAMLLGRWRGGGEVWCEGGGGVGEG